jgi:hypothetical protein
MLIGKGFSLAASVFASSVLPAGAGAAASGSLPELHPASTVKSRTALIAVFIILFLFHLTSFSSLRVFAILPENTTLQAKNSLRKHTLQSI